MNVSMEYNESIRSIDSMIANMPKVLEKEDRIMLKKIGAINKNNVKKYLHSSQIENLLKDDPKNYDGSKPYVHVKDDVVFKVRKNKNGDWYVTTMGGKYTGYKWLFLSDGHIARDGHSFITGTKFIDKAIRDSEPDVNRLISEMMKKVVE